MKFLNGACSFVFVLQLVSWSLLSTSSLARQTIPDKADPFGCSGSQKCNTSAIQIIEQKGFKSLGYDEARIQIYHKLDVYNENGTSYVDCVYSEDRTEQPDHGLPNHDQFNTEHTVPQSYLKSYPQSSLSRADLHHLFPSGSKINSIRGNFPFNECEAKNENQGIICPDGRSFMPPKKQRGATARAVFYMSIMYNLPINDREEGVLRNWNFKYPPSAKELERNTKIHNVQGNRNPFVTNPEWVSLISDF